MLKKAPEEVPILTMKILGREEVFRHNLNGRLEVILCLVSVSFLNDVRRREEILLSGDSLLWHAFVAHY